MEKKKFYFFSWFARGWAKHRLQHHRHITKALHANKQSVTLSSENISALIISCWCSLSGLDIISTTLSLFCHSSLRGINSEPSVPVHRRSDWWREHLWQQMSGDLRSSLSIHCQSLHIWPFMHSSFYLPSLSTSSPLLTCRLSVWCGGVKRWVFSLFSIVCCYSRTCHWSRFSIDLQPTHGPGAVSQRKSYGGLWYGQCLQADGLSECSSSSCLQGV